MKKKFYRRMSIFLVILFILSMFSIDALGARPSRNVVLTLLTDLPNPLTYNQEYAFEVRASERGASNPVWDISTLNGTVVTLVKEKINNSVTATFEFTATSSDTITIKYSSDNEQDVAPLDVEILVEDPNTNTPPEFTGDYVVDGETVTSLKVEKETELIFAAEATDVDSGDTLTFGIDTYPSSAEGTLQYDINDDKKYHFMPVTGFTGTASFTISVSDGINDPVLKPVNVEVIAPPPLPNNPPVFTGDYIVGGETVTSLAVEEDTELVFTAVATDSDSDPLTFGIYSLPSSTEGTLEYDVNNDKMYHFMPAQDFDETATFTISVSDGVNDPVTQVVSVVVNPLNDAPVIIAPTIEDKYDIDVEENGTHSFTIAATDAEGDSLTYSVAGSSSATIEGTVVTYNAGSTGSDTFEIRVTESDTQEKLFDILTVNVTISDGEVVYVALGDSIPYGRYYTGFWNYLFGGTDTNSYVEQLAAGMEAEPGNFQFHDMSVSGHNTVDVYKQLDGISAIISDADYITLCVGANDIMDAASRGTGGLNKYDISWDSIEVGSETEETGRYYFEYYWWQIIDKIEEMNPDVTLAVMTVYNPYHEDDSFKVDGIPIYQKVDPYFTSSSGTLGLNYIINNTKSLYDDKIDSGFDYRVADVYSAFNDFDRVTNNFGLDVPYDSSVEQDKDYLTGFYDSFCDPHPNQYGQDLIHNLHYDVLNQPQY